MASLVSTTVNGNLTIAGNSATDSHNIVFNDTSGEEWYIEYNGGLRFVESGAAQRLLIADGGNVTFSNSIYLVDSNTSLSEGSANSLRITTNSGYVDVGPQNTTYCHIQTDRNRFYFNRELIVDSGIIRSYNEDLQFDASYSGAVAKNIIFRTGNVEKVRINTNGSIGIGTTNPAQGFVQIEGPTLTMNTEGSYADKHFYMRYVGENNKGRIRTDGNMTFETGGTPVERMRVEYGGYVGIGTTNPGELLEVGNDGNTDYALIGPTKIGGGFGHGDYAGFSHRDRSSTTSYALLQHTGGTTYLNSNIRIYMGVNNANYTAQVESDRFQVNNALKLNDNSKIKIGNSDDLEIYHDGSNSYIKEASTGDIILDTNSNIRFKSSTEHLLNAAANGAVELYYNNAKVFQTTASGVKLSQSVGYLFGGDSEILAGQDTSGYYFATGAGQNVNKPIFIGDNASYIKFKTSDAEVVRIDGSGNVGINITNPTYKLHVSANSTTLAMFDGGNQNNWVAINSDNGKSAGIKYLNAGTAKWFVGHYNGAPGGFSIYDAGAAAVQLYVEEGGKVGIGTTDPGQKLDVVGIIRSKSTNPQVRIHTSSGTGAGYLVFGDSSDDDRGQIYYSHSNDSMVFIANATNMLTLTSGALYPSSNGTKDLGLSGNRWNNVYSEAGNFSGTVTANTFSGSGASLTTLNAANLGSGTVPLARMNKVLPTSGNYVWSNSTTAGNYTTGLQLSFVRGADGWPDYGSVLHVGARGGTDAGGDFQIYCGHGSNNGGNYLRVRNADNNASPTDSWTDWRTIWDSGNDGSGSGLDADLLDGLDYTSFAYRASGGTGYYIASSWLQFSGTYGLYWNTGVGAGWHIYPASTDSMRWRAAGAGVRSNLRLDVGASNYGNLCASTTMGYGLRRGGVTLSTDSDWDLLINTDGNVGIGTTDPSKALHVIGAAFIDNTESTEGLTVEATTNASITLQAAQNTAYHAKLSAHYNYTTPMTLRGYGGIVLAQNTGYTKTLLYASNAEQIRITTTGVGIGLGGSDPTTKLHVYGNNTVSSLPNLAASFSATGTGGLAIGDENGTDPYLGLLVATDNFHIKTGGNNKRVTVLSSGSVGIGDASPSYSLDVNGDIRAQSDLYIGTGGGHFYSDTGSRIRTNQDFYTNNSNTYLYGNNTYLGASSGDVIHVRDNSFRVRQVRAYNGNGIQFQDDSGTEYMRLRDGGNVGIGTTAPSARLHIGNSSSSTEPLRLQKSDDNVSNHVTFYSATTRVGEIGCQDTTWLRINQVTNKNIYTPRLIRADGGFQVDGNTVITGGGIHAGSGAQLTSLNGSNIGSGTVPAARLGSGSSITTKFLRGDNTWQTVSSGSNPNNATITLSAGTNLSGGGNFTTNQSSNETITFNMATGGFGAGTYGSTSDSSKIDQITLDAYGRVTNITTGGTGDITAVNVGGALSGGGSSGSVTVSLGNAGAGAGTYGDTSNSIKIDTITLDQYGRVTAVATGATGSGSMSSWNWGISGSTTSISQGETVRILAGTNVTVSRSGNDVTINASGGGSTPNNKTITLSAGTGLSNGGAFTTNQSFNETITFNVDGTVCRGIDAPSGSATPSSGEFDFLQSGGITVAASGNNVTFSSSSASDYRLKKNVTDFNSESWTKVKSVSCRKFDFDAEKFAQAMEDDYTIPRPASYGGRIGFIAHELEAAGIDGAVEGEKDGVDEDGVPIYQKVSYTTLVPVLWGALNEAIRKIEILESKVQALEDSS